MVPGWVPFKIVSDSSTLHSRWLLLQKIEISSIVLGHDPIHITILKTNENTFLINEDVYTVIHWFRCCKTFSFNEGLGGSMS
jgi:hypothetical protein